MWLKNKKTKKKSYPNPPLQSTTLCNSMDTGWKVLHVNFQRSRFKPINLRWHYWQTPQTSTPNSSPTQMLRQVFWNGQKGLQVQDKSDGNFNSSFLSTGIVVHCSWLHTLCSSYDFTSQRLSDEVSAGQAFTLDMENLAIGRSSH